MKDIEDAGQGIIIQTNTHIPANIVVMMSAENRQPGHKRMTPVLTLLIAAGLDLIFPDPPTALHPVGWMGKWIGFFSERALAIPPKREISRFLSGLALTAGGAALCAGGAVLTAALLKELPAFWTLSLGAVLLKPMFTIRGLIGAASEIETALSDGNLSDARRLTAWHLVSRDTSRLSERDIASCVVESLAENLTDSFFAPIFYFAMAGLPAAWLYRFINTADAMIGYRNEKWEQIGKTAARIDDLLNLLPARISALFLCLCAPTADGNPAAGFALLRSDRRKTESPNAGWTMAAAAGILGVRLEKAGSYTLNESGRAPSAADIRNCVRLIRAAAIASFTALLTGVGVIALIQVSR